MSNDDKPFLDVVSGHLGPLPVLLRKYTDEAADYIEDHVDQAATFVRQTINSTPWVPEVIKGVTPAPPPPPDVAAVALSRFERFQDWVARHKILTGFIVVTCSYGVYKGYLANKSFRKIRRARGQGTVDAPMLSSSRGWPLFH
uniref:Uncharacterized protein n=1 Tax=Bionectria ochroleuca TaxID=29856 RepID=A0A8H7N7E1_BIOOC